jgi:hypothetical protein
VIDAHWLVVRRDREVHPRILEHPFRIIGLRHDTFGTKERLVEVDRGGKIDHADMHMQSFYKSLSG